MLKGNIPGAGHLTSALSERSQSNQCVFSFFRQTEHGYHTLFQPHVPSEQDTIGACSRLVQVNSDYFSATS